MPRRRSGAMADLGPIEKELHVYNWSDYIAEDTVPNFEKEFGVKVTYDTYESNEEMVAKLQACRDALRQGVGDVLVANGRRLEFDTLANGKIVQPDCTQVVR